MRIQPNFSWQSYEGAEEDRESQFLYQLQRQYIVIANGLNTTVNDASFFLTPRQTDFSWITGKPTYTVTVPTSTWITSGTVSIIPLPIEGNFTVINMVCCISNGTLSTSSTLLLPNLDVTTAANSISIIRNGTTVVLKSGGTNYSAYSGFVTVYYITS